MRETYFESHSLINVRAVEYRYQQIAPTESDAVAFKYPGLGNVQRYPVAKQIGKEQPVALRQKNFTATRQGIGEF